MDQNNNLVTAYSTKYVLTHGQVSVVKGHERHHHNAFDVVVCDGAHGNFLPLHKGEYFFTIEEANQNVLKRIERKRLSLKKQLQKLGDLEASLKS